MKKKSKISIIIPVFNMEKYLGFCLKSIAEQTYQDFEVLMVDDGSTDGGLSLLEKQSDTDNRFVAFSKNNEGVSSARNFGLSKATGEWIMFVDPDDFLAHDALERMIAKTTSDVDIISCCCQVIRRNGSELSADHFFPHDFQAKSEKDKEPLYFQLLDSSYGQPAKAITAIGVPWGKLYRHDFLINNKLSFDVSLKRAQDNSFNMYAFHQARTIVYLDLPLYFYRYEHADNYFINHPDPKIVISIAEARRKCIEFFGLNKEKNFYQRYLFEKLSLFILIIQIFLQNTSEKNIAWKEAKKELSTILESDAFNELDQQRNSKFFSGLKMRIKWRSITKKRFGAFRFYFFLQRIKNH